MFLQFVEVGLLMENDMVHVKDYACCTSTTGVPIVIVLDLEVTSSLAFRIGNPVKYELSPDCVRESIASEQSLKKRKLNKSKITADSADSSNNALPPTPVSRQTLKEMKLIK